LFDLTSVLGAICLAAFSHKKYRFTAILVAIEFVLTWLAYEYVLIELRSKNPAIIYVLYIFIQTLVLTFMYAKQTHFIIAGLIFSNLVYYYLTILQFVNITSVNFYGYKDVVVSTIMILELIYLLGITTYVSQFLKRNGYIDIDTIDSFFLVRRRRHGWNLVQGNEK